MMPKARKRALRRIFREASTLVLVFPITACSAIQRAWEASGTGAPTLFRANALFREWFCPFTRHAYIYSWWWSHPSDSLAQQQARSLALLLMLEIIETP